MRHQLAAHSPSPKPAGWSGAGTAGTLGRTAVRRKGPLARTSATANSRDARSSRGTAARGVSTSSGCGSLPPPGLGRSLLLVPLGDGYKSALCTRDLLIYDAHG